MISDGNEEIKKYTFIDLFSGIGGIRLGFERSNCECVHSIEIDKNASITYGENFGNRPLNYDIRWKSTDTIPDFDILCGGFPCQAFSIEGKRKGFEDTRGTLFFEIIRILNNKKPKAFFLENVVNLINHDNGNTFKVIQKSIEELGYSFYYKVINSKLLVPQNRERIYMIGFNDRNLNFTFPQIPNLNPSLKNVIENEVDSKYFYKKNDSVRHNKFKECMKEDNTIYQEMFGEIRKTNGNICPTLMASYGDNKPLLLDKKEKIPRKLTPREWARLQGFPDTFKIKVSDNQAYHQFGNSVTVPIVEYLAKEIVRTLNENPKRIDPYTIQKSMMDY